MAAAGRDELQRAKITTPLTILRLDSWESPAVTSQQQSIWKHSHFTDLISHGHLKHLTAAD